MGDVNPLHLAARSASYLGLVLLAGGGVFRAALPSPSTPAAIRRMLRIGLVAGLILLAAGSVADVWCNCFAMLGSVSLGDLVDFFRHTHQGRAVAWRLGLAVPLAAVLWGGARWRALPAAVLAVGVLATFTTVSHAASTRAGLPMAMDMVHLSAVVTWPALLIYFSLLRSDPARLAVLPRMSALSLTSVIVLVATGTYAAWVHIPSLPDLWQTPYGRVLCVKVGLIGIMLVLGGVNRQRLMPRLPQPHALRTLVRMVYVEAALVVVVLAFSALLATRDLPSRHSAPPPWSSTAVLRPIGR